MILLGQRAVRGRGRVPERDRDERPAGAGAVDAVADDGRPLHVDRRVRRQAVRGDGDLRVDRARRRGELRARRRRGGEAASAAASSSRRASAQRSPASRCCAFGRPLSFVTVNVNLSPVPHGIGDCWMFRYLKLIASATSIVCPPTGPGGADVRHRRAARPVRHHRADVVVVVQERRAALVQRRAEPVVRDRDHRADRALLRADRRRAGDRKPPFATWTPSTTA